MSASLSHRAMATILLVLICPALLAQSQPDVSKFTLHATIASLPDGDLRIQASSPRPLYQAISALVFQYGLVIDYEDPWYVSTQMNIDANGRMQLIGGQFAATIPQISKQKNEYNALRQLVKQFNARGGTRFELIKHREGNRFDIAGETSLEKPMFDTPIYMEKKSRTAQEAIREIIRQVGQVRGTTILEGGLVNNALTQTEVMVGGPEREPARKLLAEVLDDLPTQNVWLLTYEPSWRKFVIAIHAASQDRRP